MGKKGKQWEKEGSRGKKREKKREAEVKRWKKEGSKGKKKEAEVKRGKRWE